MKRSLGFLLPLALAGTFAARSAVAQSPAPPASPAAISWLGITLGQPVSELGAVLGDPLHVTRIPQDVPDVPPDIVPQRKARYWLLSGAAYLLVTEMTGRVEEIEAFADGLNAPVPGLASDPFGGRLGTSEGEAETTHPAFRKVVTDDGTALVDRSTNPGITVIYDVRNGRVRALRWIDHRPDAGPVLPPFAEPDGATPATAVRSGETLDDKNVDWEYAYLRYHPCAKDSSWRLVRQSLLSGPPALDKLEVACPATGTAGTFYFDISASLGHR